MRIRFFNTYEPVTDIYRHIVPTIVAGGADVNLYVSRCDYRVGRRSLEESVGGEKVSIRRMLGPSGWARNRRYKAIAAAGYALHASFASLFGRSVDTNVFLTQPPLFSVWGVLLKKLRGQRLVLVLMDLYPDVLFASGKARSTTIIGRILMSLSRLAWRNADAIIVIGRCMRKRVIACGIPDSRIHIVPNWVDTDTIRPLAHADNPMRRELGLQDSFVVLYSGNMGEAHYFDTILDSARELGDIENLRFVMIGQGVRRPYVERRIAELGLENILLLDYQPEEKMRFSQGLGDIHFVCLDPQFTGLMVPSKTYGAFAAGRPVLYEGTPDSEVARVIAESSVGKVVPYMNQSRMTAVLRDYCRDPNLAREQGLRARALAEGQLSMRRCIDAYAAVLANV